MKQQQQQHRHVGVVVDTPVKSDQAPMADVIIAGLQGPALKYWHTAHKGIALFISSLYISRLEEYFIPNHKGFVRGRIWSSRMKF